jgi:hypothetical protein
MKVYTTQTDLELRVSTNKILTGATAEIRYKDPRGKQDGLTGTISNNVVSYFNNIENPFTIVGVWTFWLKINNADGTVSIGNPFHLRFNEAGT